MDDAEKVTISQWYWPGIHRKLLALVKYKDVKEAHVLEYQWEGLDLR